MVWEKEEEKEISLTILQKRKNNAQVFGSPKIFLVAQIRDIIILFPLVNVLSLFHCH